MTADSQAPDFDFPKRYPRLARTGRLVGYCATLTGTIVLLLIVINTMAATVLWGLKVWREPAEELTGVDRRARLPVYHGAPEERQFYDTIKMHFEPHFHWRRDPFASPYLNVDASGMRKTVKSPASGATRVFVFGGSTTWGTGVADAYTIPSQLQQRLGPRYDVYNYGESAFMSVQELNLLLRELAFGNVPDVVIFYDGINDLYAGAYSPAIPRDPQFERDYHAKVQLPLSRRVIGESSLYKLFVDLRGLYHTVAGRASPWDSKVAPQTAERAKKTLDAYEQFVIQARAIAGAYGFKVYFFWQPNLLTGTRAAQPHELEIIRDTSPSLRAAMQHGYTGARARLTQRESENVFFLGNVLDNVNEPLYIDPYHLGPRGNELMAEEIYRRLTDRL